MRRIMIPCMFASVNVWGDKNRIRHGTYHVEHKHEGDATAIPVGRALRRLGKHADAEDAHQTEECTKGLDEYVNLKDRKEHETPITSYRGSFSHITSAQTGSELYGKRPFPCRERRNGLSHRLVIARTHVPTRRDGSLS